MLVAMGMSHGELSIMSPVKVCGFPEPHKYRLLSDCYVHGGILLYNAERMGGKS